MSDILNKAIDERRRLILNWLYNEVNGEVIYGPFKGMKIAPKYCWGDGDTGAKLLGIYENEIFGCLEETLGLNPDLIVNYGCAEGYYGLGVARLLPKAKIIFVDIEAKAIEITKENAQLNGITNCEYMQGMGKSQMEAVLSAAVNPLIIMDCEGAEDFILDPVQVPSLSKTNIIVEVHEFMSAGMTDRLIDRFNETHNLEGIPQGSKDYHIEPITVLSDLDKLILNNENRPNTMNWIYMRAKQ